MKTACFVVTSFVTFSLLLFCCCEGQVVGTLVMNIAENTLTQIHEFNPSDFDYEKVSVITIHGYPGRVMLWQIKIDDGGSEYDIDAQVVCDGEALVIRPLEYGSLCYWDFEIKVFNPSLFRFSDVYTRFSEV